MCLGHWCPFQEGHWDFFLSSGLYQGHYWKTSQEVLPSRVRCRGPVCLCKGQEESCNFSRSSGFCPSASWSLCFWATFSAILQRPQPGRLPKRTGSSLQDTTGWEQKAWERNTVEKGPRESLRLGLPSSGRASRELGSLPSTEGRVHASAGG